MGMGINKAGQQQRASGIQYIFFIRLPRRRHRAERCNAAAGDIHIAILNDRGVHRHNLSMYNAHGQNSFRA